MALILAVTKPLGLFMARVFGGERTFLSPVLRPLERLLYRLTGVDPSAEMSWSQYAVSFVLFGLTGTHGKQRGVVRREWFDTGRRRHVFGGGAVYFFIQAATAGSRRYAVDVDGGGGDRVRAVEALAQRIEDARPDVAVDDAEGGKREQRQTTAVRRLAVRCVPVLVREGGVFDDRFLGRFFNYAPQTLVP